MLQKTYFLFFIVYLGYKLIVEFFTWQCSSWAPYIIEHIYTSFLGFLFLWLFLFEGCWRHLKALFSFLYTLSFIRISFFFCSFCHSFQPHTLSLLWHSTDRIFLLSISEYTSQYKCPLYKKKKKSYIFIINK